LAAEALAYVEGPQRLACLRIGAADQSGRRGVVDLAAMPGGSGVGAGVGAVRLPGYGVAGLPDRLAARRVQAEEVLTGVVLPLRVQLAGGDDEARVPLAQF